MESAQICAVLMVSIPVTLGKNRAVMSLCLKCHGLRSEKIAGVGSWVGAVAWGCASRLADAGT